MSRQPAGRAEAGDVRRAAATIFAGLEVGNLYEQQKVSRWWFGAPGSPSQPYGHRELLSIRRWRHVRWRSSRRGRARDAAGIAREGIAAIRHHAGGRDAASAKSQPLSRKRCRLWSFPWNISVLRTMPTAGPTAATASPRSPRHRDLLRPAGCFQRRRGVVYRCLRTIGGLAGCWPMGGTFSSVAGRLLRAGTCRATGLLLVKAYQRAEASAESRPQLVRRAA